MNESETCFDLLVEAPQKNVINWFGWGNVRFSKPIIELETGKYLTDFRFIPAESLSDTPPAIVHIKYFGRPYPISGVFIGHDGEKEIVIKLGEGKQDTRARVILVYIRVLSLAENRSQAIGFSHHRAFDDYLTNIGVQIADYFPTIKKYIPGMSLPIEEKPISRGLSDWRERRAILFKQTKNRCPELSMDEVAKRAGKIAFERIRNALEETYHNLSPAQLDEKALDEFENQFGPGKHTFSKDDVKNGYRAMGWKWKCQAPKNSTIREWKNQACSAAYG